MGIKLSKLTLKIGFYSMILIVIALTVFSGVLLKSESDKLSKDILEKGLVFAEFATQSIYQKYATEYTHSRDHFYIFKDMATETLNKNTDVFKTSLISINGKILFDTDEFEANEIYSGPGRFIDDPETLNYLKNEKVSYKEIDYEGKEVIEIFVPVKETTGSHLMVMRYLVSYESMRTRMNEIIRQILFTFFIVLLMTVLLAIPFSITLTKPIIKLRNTTVEIANGNLDIKTDIKSKDEIGDLATSFESMAEVLQKSRQTLQEYSKTLEKKVKERTKELDKKVLELEKKDKQIVTINRNLEEANQRLKELDKEKDEFISVAAHELKTPLTSIRGFTQLMKNVNVLKNKKKTEHFLNLVNQNTDRLYNLVIDLVDSSRISIGKLSLDIKKIDIYQIYKEIKENLSVIMQEKGIKPVFSIDDKLPKINADPARVLQVLRNLMINAIHFTEKGGTVSLNINKKGKFVQFEIKDTGEGIPKDKQQFIFSRFYQVDTSLARKVKGSGLGLSICKGLIEMMKGKIWFESEEGKGSTFYFKLPAVK